MAVKRFGVGRRQGAAASILLGLVVAAPLGRAATAGEARTVVEQWVAVERAISEEAVAWKEKEELLQNLIQSAQAERGNLNAQIADARETMNVADQKRAELMSQRQELDASAAMVFRFLAKMEQRLRQLKVRLPQPLQESLAAHFEKLPMADTAASAQGPSIRMQNVVSILDTIQKFDDMPPEVYEVVRPLADGSMGAVQTLYLGLGAAYYLSESDEDAGFGVPSEAGWSWVSRPEIAAAVKEAIAIAEEKVAEAKFILLPVQGLKRN